MVKNTLTATFSPRHLPIHTSPYRPLPTCRTIWICLAIVRWTFTEKSKMFVPFLMKRTYWDRESVAHSLSHQKGQEVQPKHTNGRIYKGLKRRRNNIKYIVKSHINGLVNVTDCLQKWLTYFHSQSQSTHPWVVSSADSGRGHRICFWQWTTANVIQVETWKVFVLWGLPFLAVLENSVTSEWNPGSHRPCPWTIPSNSSWAGPEKELPSRPTESWEIINVCCFKPLNLGVLYYAARSKW